MSKRRPENNDRNAQESQDFKALIEQLMDWLKSSPEKMAEIISGISEQLLEMLPPKLRRQIRQALNARKRDPKGRKPQSLRAQQDKERADQVPNRENERLAPSQDQSVDVIKETIKEVAAGHAKTQEPNKTIQPSTDKLQEKQPEKQIKKEDNKQQEKRTTKSKDKGKPKGPKPPKAKVIKVRIDNSEEMLAAFIEDEKRKYEIQKVSAEKTELPSLSIGNQQDKAALAIAEKVIDYAAKHGVDVNPQSLSNDKSVTPMAATDSNSLNAANAKKNPDGRGA